MTWSFLLLLAAACYVQKAAAPLLAGAWQPPPRARALLHLLAVPLLVGLVIVQTLSDGRELVVDARAPAVLVTAVAAWRGAPFLAVVLLAGPVAAGVRVIA